mgnify:CR=1 FL=1
MNMSIRLENVNYIYGEGSGQEKWALKNINLDIYENQITAFIGPSGCGKSTYLKTLNRMNDLVPNVTINGKVVIDGEDIYDPKVDTTLLRKKVGMVFQQPNPFPMSIYDNIAYGPRIHGIKGKAELDAIVEKSLRGAALWDEVKDRLKRSALGLSGGQQQRLCIARALAVDPEVILMDEPTNHLDLEAITALNNGLIDFGGNLLFTSHDHQFVDSIANRIIELTEDGMIDRSMTFDDYLSWKKEKKQ